MGTSRVAANMLVSRNGQAYVSDANGNTLSGGGRVNTWDSQNRLVQCVSGGNTSQFVYGADGLRRTSIVNGNPVHSVLDSGMMVREMVPSGQTFIPKATYLIGPRGPEYRRDDQTQAIRWYLYDGLGSVLGEVDTAGNLTASLKPRQGSVSGYDVYGLVRAGDSGTSRHKYVGSLGHTSEDETGLIYMRARWMDPALGRFISEDPARDGANWFEYCRGNPVNAVDPDGCVWSPPILLLGLLAVICIGLALTTGNPYLLAIGCALLIIDVVLALWQAQSDMAPNLRRLKERQMRQAGDESACLRALDAATAMKQTSGGGSWLMKVGAVFVEQLAWLGLSE